MRREIFQINEYYHIYNRGVDKREIFLDEFDYAKFLKYTREFSRGPASLKEAGPPVLLLAYAFCINHYHFLLKQTKNKGISEFMQKLGTAYTMRFNSKYKRSGVLFQGKFKASHIKTNGQLWRLACYINGNPEIHKICKAENWPWSSCKDYLGLRKGTLCDKQTILQDFSGLREYKNLLYAIIKENQDIKDDKDEI